MLSPQASLGFTTDLRVPVGKAPRDLRELSCPNVISKGLCGAELWPPKHLQVFEQIIVSTPFSGWGIWHLWTSNMDSMQNVPLWSGLQTPGIDDLAQVVRICSLLAAFEHAGLRKLRSNNRFEAPGWFEKLRKTCMIHPARISSDAISLCQVMITQLMQLSTKQVSSISMRG